MVKYFIGRYPRNAGRKIRNLDPRTLEWLLAYDRQVDIRELQNMVVRAVILFSRVDLSIDKTWIELEKPDRAREWLVQLYQAWGKPGTAGEWKKK